MPRILPIAAAVLLAAPAPAATDGTSNTLMTARSAPAASSLIGITAIEFKNTGFMDYIDDV